MRLGLSTFLIAALTASGLGACSSDVVGSTSSGGGSGGSDTSSQGGSTPTTTTSAAGTSGDPGSATTATVTATTATSSAAGTGGDPGAGGSSSETTSGVGGDTGAGGSGAGDGVCEVENVADPEACDVDCDVTIDGGEGAYQCTTSCDPAAQDCGPTERENASFYCVYLDEGTGACFFDCADGWVCPLNYYCDQDLLFCVPDAVDG